MFNKFFSLFSRPDIGIDLGTANTIVYVKGQGIVIREPSVVAINQKTGEVLAIGSEAKKMVGRTPAYITASRPLVDGVVSDFEVTEQMLRYFIDKVSRGHFFLSLPPRLVIGIPCGVTEVEKKAVNDAAKSAGAREVFLIEEPMAAAIGSRLPVQEAGGNMIVDIGGGTTEVAVISLGGIVLSRSLRIAGDELNLDIIHYGEEEYKLVLGERMAEEVKIKIGSALPPKEPQQTTIRGRGLIDGLPKEIEATDEEIREALSHSVQTIIKAVKDTLEETPPELIADIMSKGIIMTGGGSLLQNLDKLISQETRMPVKITEDPLTTVARGCGVVLENLDELKEVLVPMEYLEPPK